VSHILELPMPLRLAMVFVVGAFLGGAASCCADRFTPRRRSSGLPIRIILIALLTGIGLSALYWWEIGRRGLLPASAAMPLPTSVQTVLHGQYAVHVVLVWLMLLASMVDVREKIIPDAITLPGTLLGLLLAAACPWTLLPDLVMPIPPAFWQLLSVETWPFMQVASPNRWPAALHGMPNAAPLLIGLGCWWMWCLAILPRSWYARHGRLRAWQLLCARLAREPATYRILLTAVLGSAAIGGVWFCGGRPWQGLLSALAGMAASGGLVWTVRIIGTAALRREAMGFGDVTLMAMIGTFLGWQACLVVFFLAPFAGLILGLLQLILLRDTEIPYGPFLCLAALAVIVRWNSVWDWTLGVFAPGWLVPVVVLFCMVLMAVLLGLWRLVLGIFRGGLQ